MSQSEDQGITTIPKGIWIANTVMAEYVRLWTTHKCSTSSDQGGSAVPYQQGRAR